MCFVAARSLEWVSRKWLELPASTSWFNLLCCYQLYRIWYGIYTLVPVYWIRTSMVLQTMTVLLFSSVSQMSIWLFENSMGVKSPEIEFSSNVDPLQLEHETNAPSCSTQCPRRILLLFFRDLRMNPSTTVVPSIHPQSFFSIFYSPTVSFRHHEAFPYPPRSYRHQHCCCSFPYSW